MRKINKFRELLKKNRSIIVAEIGNNHEGKFNLAIKLIDEAAKCGVDAVKFQTYIPKLFVSNDYNQNSIKRLKRFQLSFEQFENLSIYAKKKGLIFFSTPLDLKSAFFLNKIQEVFKISSGDNNYKELLETVLSFKKHTIISTGMTNISDLNNIYKIAKNFLKKELNEKLVFLHCVSDYPVENKYINLNSINVLKKNFKNLNIGYSDHSIGARACLASAAMGVKIIEKHFTLDNNFSNFRDHKIASNPSEMKYLVNEIRNIEFILGHQIKIIQQNEKKNIINSRRSYATNKDLPKNSKISNEDLIMLRPSIGYSSESKKIILKSKTSKKISANSILKKNFLK